MNGLFDEACHLDMSLLKFRNIYSINTRFTCNFKAIYSHQWVFPGLLIALDVSGVICLAIELQPRCVRYKVRSAYGLSLRGCDSLPVGSTHLQF